jgi:prephenate dehydratase
VKIAFQGIKGAYSELSLLRHFGKDAEALGCMTFEEVFEAVEQGSVDFGYIPAENTIAGTVVENYDLLLSRDVAIAAEVYTPIRHTLLARKGSDPAAIRKAYSHPHALSQCRGFLKEHGIEPVLVYDTAGAARMVSRSKETDCAAIASELCAEYYDLDILNRNIQSNVSNSTRFFVIARKDRLPDPIPDAAKTSLAFQTRHYPGALVDCLTIFKRHNLNLTKLESRPIPAKPWKYTFYTDFEGGIQQDDVRFAFMELESRALMVKLLGSYPSHKTE